MSVEKVADRFVIPCREWAAVHLGLDITYNYKTKRNAERAVKCPKRNQVTQLCHYMQRLYARVCHLEIILLRVNKEIADYDFNACDSTTGSDAGTGDKTVEGGGEGSGGSGVTTEGNAA